jgi:hypothetical protein
MKCYPLVGLFTQTFVSVVWRFGTIQLRRTRLRRARAESNPCLTAGSCQPDYVVIRGTRNNAASSVSVFSGLLT